MKRVFFTFNLLKSCNSTNSWSSNKLTVPFLYIIRRSIEILFTENYLCFDNNLHVSVPYKITHRITKMELLDEHLLTVSCDLIDMDNTFTPGKKTPILLIDSDSVFIYFEDDLERLNNFPNSYFIVAGEPIMFEYYIYQEFDVL